MAASSNDQWHRMIGEQTQLVAAAETALARAERAVTQARTLSAAADAHRRADAALVELAEAELRRLTQQQTAQADKNRTETRRSQPAPADQAPLFEVG